MMLLRVMKALGSSMPTRRESASVFVVESLTLLHDIPIIWMELLQRSRFGGAGIRLECRLGVGDGELRVNGVQNGQSNLSRFAPKSLSRD